MVAVILILTTVSVAFSHVWIGDNFHEDEIYQTDNGSSIMEILLSVNDRDIRDLITKKSLALKTALRIASNLGKNEKELTKRRKLNLKLVKCLIKINGSLPDASIWMKNNLDEIVAATVIDDMNHSDTTLNTIIDRCREKKFSVMDTWNKDKSRKKMTKFLSRFLLTANCYLDLIMDIALLYVVTKVQSASQQFMMESLSCQIIMILALSIAVPLFKSAITTAFLPASYCLTIFGYRTWRKHSEHLSGSYKILLRAVTLVFFPFVPALLMNNTIEVEENRARLERWILEQPQEFTSLRTSIDDRTKFIEEARKVLLIFKRNELFIEIMTQLPIHLFMLLLSETKYPLENGLQAVFNQNNNNEISTVALLIFSTLWSFKTAAMTYVKIKTEEKQYLKFLAKFVIGLRSMIVFSVRIVCFISYFAPFMGLVGLLNHYHAEQISLSHETLQTLEGFSKDFRFWNMEKDMSQSRPLTDIYRSDYTTDPDNPIPPPITAYTIISKEVGYLLFPALCILYFCVVWCLKSWLSYNFRRITTFSKLQHVIEVMNIPDTCGDWDSNPTNPDDCKRAWHQHLVEIISMVALQCISNMVLLIPTLITGEWLFFFSIKVSFSYRSTF